MQLTCQIRLRTPVLGDRRTREQTRLFSKDGHNNWLISIPQWRWAFSEAISDMKLTNINPDYIRFESAIRLPKIEMYERRWSDNKNKQSSEIFESIRKNTKLTFRIIVTSELEPGTYSRKDTQPPTIPEIELILKYIGEMLGLSPWGSKFGYGRFTVLDVSDNANKPISKPAANSSPSMG
jgi:hypothetical protein